MSEGNPFPLITAIKEKVSSSALGAIEFRDVAVFFFKKFYDIGVVISIF